MAVRLAVLVLVLLSGCEAGWLDGKSGAAIPWFILYFGIMTGVVVLLLLVLVLLLACKLNRLVAKMDQISNDAGKFLKMGMTFFKKK